MMYALGAIAEVSTGYPFRKKVESEEGGDLVLVQMKDIDGAGGVVGPGTITLRSTGASYHRYLLRDGDLLFQSRGSRHPAAIVQPGIRGIAAAGLHVIRADQHRVRPDYLAWWLNHPRSQAKITEDLARGSYIPFVSKADLLAFLVPVPTMPVQQRIVEIDRLRRRERELATQHMELTEQLVDCATLAVVTQTQQRSNRHD